MTGAGAAAAGRRRSASCAAARRTRPRYYVNDDPLVGDDVYDELIDELRAIEEDIPDLRTPDSPTECVGGKPVDGLDSTRSRADALARERSQR